MSEDRIKIAEAEAKRFLSRVTAWRKAQSTYVAPNGMVFSVSTPRESGALRRASLDLTRALAAMRKPG